MLADAAMAQLMRIWAGSQLAHIPQILRPGHFARWDWRRRALAGEGGFAGFSSAL
jgi:hypothetical protein